MGTQRQGITSNKSKRPVSCGFIHVKWVHTRPNVQKYGRFERAGVAEKQRVNGEKGGVRSANQQSPCANTVAHQGRAKLTGYTHR